MLASESNGNIQKFHTTGWHVSESMDEKLVKLKKKTHKLSLVIVNFC